NGNGNHSENGFFKEQPSPIKITQKSNGLHEDQSTSKSDSYIFLTGHRAGEAAIVYEHGADIEALMPKLRHSDYYTEPRVQELAAKERRRVEKYTEMLKRKAEPRTKVLSLSRMIRLKGNGRMMVQIVDLKKELLNLRSSL
nr:nuclear pore complex protein NUP98A [Tanacetum cinerariifolium]